MTTRSAIHIFLITALVLTGQLTFGVLSSPEEVRRRIDISSLADPSPTVSVEDTGDHIDNQLVIDRRRAEARDIEKLIRMQGVGRKGVNYNRVIDGHGTGLRPPTKEEWARIGGEMNVVEDISTLTRDPPAASVDHAGSKYFPPIGNQGAEGSCVAWAVGYYTKTYQEAKEHDWNLSGASWLGGYTGNPSVAYQDRIMSPDFIYHQINDGVDEGSYYSSAMDLVNRTGISSWKEMPYNTSDHTSWPSESAWREAPWYRSSQGYNYIWLYPPYNGNGLTSLKTWIDGGNLAVVSVNASQYDQLDGNDLWKNDTYDGSGTNHAGTVVGYDDNFGPYNEDGGQRTGAFKIANSWGTGWTGDNNNDGMYWISYESMKWDIAYSFFYQDRIAYEPEVLSVFEMTHSKRGECNVSFGIGDPSSPVNVKRFDDWSFDYDGGEQPFPNNKMVLDITGFKYDVQEINGSQLFMKVNDTESVTTGSMDSFAVEYYSDYRNGTLYVSNASSDPTVNTVQGSTAKATLNLSDNISPVADAGADRYVDRDTEVTFDGTNSSDNAGIANYIWSFEDGASRKLYGAAPAYTFNNAGYFGVTLNVSDPTGNWATDLVNVTVNETHPTASAGPDSWIDVGETVNFDGSNSTDDVGITNYTWTFVDGELRSLYGAEPAYTFRDVGKFAVTLNVTDADGHWDTDVTNITVNDTEAPAFGTIWNQMLTTGEDAVFSANITDNGTIDGVWLDLNLGGGWRNWSVTNRSGDSWSIRLKMPDEAETVEYTFRANDTGGNWASSPTFNKSVSDNDDPVFGATWAGELTTGDKAFFSANVTDNTGVHTVKFVFSVNGVGYNWTVSNSTGDSFYLTITVPPNTTSFRYRFWANDSSDNRRTTGMKNPAVTDDDSPVFGTAWAGATTTGDKALFSINVTDNIAVGTVLFDFSVNGVRRNWTVSNVTGDSYHISIILPSDATSLNYSFWASDSGGNGNTSGAFRPAVSDDDPPYSWNPRTGELTTGDPATFRVNLSDNLDIDTVDFRFSINEGPQRSYSVLNSTGDVWWINITLPADAATIEYHFRVNDSSGNENTTSSEERNVRDDDVPLPDGGGDRQIPQHTGITLNASGSLDNIGITSYNWSLVYNGTEHVFRNTSFDFTFDLAGTYTAVLNVSDAAGNWATDRVRVRVKDITPPRADAGEDMDMSEHELARFDGGNSRDNVGITEYSWSIVLRDMRVVLIGERPSFRFERGGSYDVVLTVKDGEGNSDSDVVRVDVSDITQPVAEAGEDRIADQFSTLVFDASNSRDNVGIANYTWFVNYGKVGVELFGEETKYTFDEVGEYRVELVVFDGDGNNDTDSFTVTIKDITEPRAIAGDDIAVDQDVPVRFNGSDSRDNAGIANYTWRFLRSGEEVVLYGSEPVAVFHNVGRYSVTLTVRDAAGLESSDTVNVTVRDVTPPYADAGENIIVGQDIPFELNASGSSDNVVVTNYTWLFEYKDKGYVLYGMTHVLEFHDLGKYTITLNVIDAEGNWGGDEAEVTVTDIERPRSDAGKGAVVTPGEKVSFNGTGEDNRGIVNYTWRFFYNGSLVELYGQTPSFVFDKPGRYFVTLEVSDAAGNKQQDGIYVNVAEEETSVSSKKLGEKVVNDPLYFIVIFVLLLLLSLILLRMKVRKKEKAEGDEEEVEKEEEEEEEEEYTGGPTAESGQGGPRKKRGKGRRRRAQERKHRRRIESIRARQAGIITEEEEEIDEFVIDLDEEDAEEEEPKLEVGEIEEEEELGYGAIDYEFDILEKYGEVVRDYEKAELEWITLGRDQFGGAGAGRYTSFAQLDIEYEDSRYVGSGVEGTIEFECSECWAFVNYEEESCPNCGERFD